MANLSDNFKKFLENIELTEYQVEDGDKKATSVCKTLHEHYYDENYTGSTKLLIGSFGKNTAIRPPSDVDVIFLLPQSEKERYDKRSGNGQSQLLQDVKNLLLKTYPLTDIKGDGPVVMINFDSYKIEVTPSFKSFWGYSVPLTRDDGNWENINPIREKEEIIKSNERSKGNTRNLIKMIKKWKNYCNVPLKSFYIELLVIDFLEENEQYYYGFHAYDMLLYEFFKFLLGSKNKIKILPGIINFINYGDTWESKAKTACKNARNAWLSDSKEDAIDYLRKIFGYNFPK